MNAMLTRLETSDEGTFGTLTFDDGHTWQTGELPWRNNGTGKSSIPTGSYLVSQFYSNKHGKCFLVNAVPGRSDVEIHAANWMGDRSLGYKCELLGCIAVGKSQEEIGGQQALGCSRQALEELLAYTHGQSFHMTIVENYGNPLD